MRDNRLCIDDYHCQGKMSLLSLIIKLRLATGLILQCPLYGVLKHLDEGGIREKRGTVAELEINVLGLLALVGPNHGVVAHANSGRRDVAVLIDVGKHMHVLPWILVVGVPLVFLNQEVSGTSFITGCRLSSTSTVASVSVLI